MNKAMMFALATSVVLGLGSSAMAGEGSPDLALPCMGRMPAIPTAQTIRRAALLETRIPAGKAGIRRRRG